MPSLMASVQRETNTFIYDLNTKSIPMITVIPCTPPMVDTSIEIMDEPVKYLDT